MVNNNAWRYFILRLQLKPPQPLERPCQFCLCSSTVKMYEINGAANKVSGHNGAANKLSVKDGAANKMSENRGGAKKVPEWIEQLLVQLNVEDFITEIEARPPIWNSAIPEYSDNVETEKAWFEVCSKFDVDFETRDQREKNMLGKQLHRRWKSLRDCYRRELKKLTSQKSGSAADGRKKYIYFEHLRFLEPVICISQSNFNKEEEEECIEEIELGTGENFRQNITAGPSKRQKKHAEEDALLKALKAKMIKGHKETVPVDDSDMLFMMSLVPEIKKIPDHKKLTVKAQIMNVLLQSQINSEPLPNFPQGYQIMNQQQFKYNHNSAYNSNQQVNNNQSFPYNSNSHVSNVQQTYPQPQQPYSQICTPTSTLHPLSSNQGPSLVSQTQINQTTNTAYDSCTIISPRSDVTSLSEATESSNEPFFFSGNNN